MWGAILIPIIAFNPNNLVFLLVPSLLVMAIGVHLTINYWYRLFPRNPYARVFGLIPLAILVGAIVQFNNDRYTYGMLYSQQAAAVFNNDVFLAQQAIKDMPATSNLVIVVEEGKIPLYKLAAAGRPNTQVVNPNQVYLNKGTYMVAEKQVSNLSVLPSPVPTSLIVNDHQQEALRFRVYQR
jgi:hypothetical protein